MPLPLTVSCISKIHIGFTFLVLVHPGSPGKGAVERVCVLFIDSIYIFTVFLFTSRVLYGHFLLPSALAGKIMRLVAFVRSFSL